LAFIQQALGSDRHYQNTIVATIAFNRIIDPSASRTIPMHRGRFILGISHFTPGTLADKQWVGVQQL